MARTRTRTLVLKLSAVRKAIWRARRDFPGEWQAETLEILLLPGVYRRWQALNRFGPYQGSVRRASHARWGPGYLFETVDTRSGEVVSRWNAVTDEWYSHHPSVAWDGVRRETIHTFLDAARSTATSPDPERTASHPGFVDTLRRAGVRLEIDVAPAREWGALENPWQAALMPSLSNPWLAEISVPNPRASGRYSERARAYVAEKIPKLVREGYPQQQAVAIAMSMARRRGMKVPQERKANPVSAKPRAKESYEVALEDAKELEGYEDAAALVKQFHDAEPARAIVHVIDDGKAATTRQVVAGLGEPPQIEYDVAAKASNKAGPRWYHEFPRRSRPHWVADPQTGIVSLVGGSYRIEDWWHD